MTLVDDNKLRWARGGLVVLGVVGAVAIGWAIWVVTTATTQAGQDRGSTAALERGIQAATEDAEHALAQQEWDEHENDSLTPSRVVTEPPTPVPSRATAPSPIPTAVRGDSNPGLQVGTLLPDWEEDDFLWHPWGPTVTGGPGQVAFSVTVEISDGGTETFGVADSFRGIAGMRGGKTESYDVAAGEFIIEQQRQSGWPLPEITCVGADVVVTEAVAVLDLEAGSTVACTFYNVRDADSLSVLDSAFTCAGFTGRVLGSEGPFLVSYSAEGPRSAAGSFTLFDVGTIQVDEPGRFTTPPGFIDAADLDDGDYPVWVRVHDASGGRVPLLDATIMTVGSCS